MVQLVYYQHKLKQGYDSNVRLRPLTPGDLVLRKVLGTAKNPAWGKLGPNWKRSYRITLVAKIRTYYLEDLDENVVPHPWNVNNLKGIIINESLFCHIFAYDIIRYISYHFSKC